jgi:hypothetical protein
MEEHHNQGKTPAIIYLRSLQILMDQWYLEPIMSVESEAIETIETTASNEAETASDLTQLLEEITDRCNKQTQEISKWLTFTEDFKKSIVDMSERTNDGTVVVRRVPLSPLSPTFRTPTSRRSN